MSRSLRELASGTAKYRVASCVLLEPYDISIERSEHVLDHDVLPIRPQYILNFLGVLLDKIVPFHPIDLEKCAPLRILQNLCTVSLLVTHVFFNRVQLVELSLRVESRVDLWQIQSQEHVWIAAPVLL